jgi:Tol biopolymer transport system component
MTRRFALISALATLICAAVPAVGSATFIPGPSGKIAFASGRASSEVPAPADGNDNQARIWVVDPSLNEPPVQVTHKDTTLPEEQHRHPNWSPDHTRIVYAVGTAFNLAGEYALFIVDLRTGAETLFAAAAPGQDRPSWSPDGTRIAYGSNGDLFVKGVAPGSQPVQLTSTAGVTEERPVWSPDGNTLYYTRKVGSDRDVFKKSPVSAAGAEVGIVTGATEDWQPAVSPNGSRLCYLRGAQDDTAALRTVNVDGSGDAPFVDDPTLGDLNCVWSPDGTRIMYTEGAFSGGELRTRDVNGANLQLLTGINVAKHFDGNVDWATNFPPTCDPKVADIAVNGFTSIALSCLDPDHGFGAEPPTPTPIEGDGLEIARQPAHGSLGGLSNNQVIYTPNKDFEGTDTFSYTASDSTSNAAPATVTVHVNPASAGNGGGPGQDETAPSISGLGLSSRRWRLGHALASTSRTRVGTTISFRLSEAAHTTLTFQRAGSGRHLSAGSIAVAARAGQNRVHFQGLLTRSHHLAPGSYRVVASARDAAGNQSRPLTGPTFTIVAG